MTQKQIIDGFATAVRYFLARAAKDPRLAKLLIATESYNLLLGALAHAHGVAHSDKRCLREPGSALDEILAAEKTVPVEPAEAAMIAVADELPDDEELVLLHDERADLWWIGHHEAGDFFTEDGALLERVTHWSRFPEVR